MRGDLLTEHGAKVLAHQIETYWRGKGIKSVLAWPEDSNPRAHGRIFSVRSNLSAGLPPRGD